MKNYIAHDEASLMLVDKIDLLKRLRSQYNELRGNTEEVDNYLTELDEYIYEKDADVDVDVNEWRVVSSDFQHEQNNTIKTDGKIADEEDVADDSDDGQGSTSEKKKSEDGEERRSMAESELERAILASLLTDNDKTAVAAAAATVVAADKLQEVMEFNQGDLSWSEWSEQLQEKMKDAKMGSMSIENFKLLTLISLTDDPTVRGRMLELVGSHAAGGARSPPTMRELMKTVGDEM